MSTTVANHQVETECHDHSEILSEVFDLSQIAALSPRLLKRKRRIIEMLIALAFLGMCGSVVVAANSWATTDQVRLIVAFVFLGCSAALVAGVLILMTFSWGLYIFKHLELLKERGEREEAILEHAILCSTVADVCLQDAKLEALLIQRLKRRGQMGEDLTIKLRDMAGLLEDNDAPSQVWKSKDTLKESV